MLDSGVDPIGCLLNGFWYAAIVEPLIYLAVLPGLAAGDRRQRRMLLVLLLIAAGALLAVFVFHSSPLETLVFAYILWAIACNTLPFAIEARRSKWEPGPAAPGDSNGGQGR